MGILFPIISIASDIPSIANTHKTYAGLGTTPVNRNNLNEVATRVTELTNDVNQTISSINDNLSQAGTAIQQNHDTITGHSTDISAANSRLDRQAQFDQVVGATLEANRQQTVVHGNNIASNTDNLTQAGTAIQQNSKRIDYLHEWKEISDSRIQRLESNITNNRTISSKGIAGVAAMTNIPTPADGSLSFGIGYGYYDSYDSLAIGASKYFESGIALKASVSLTSGNSVAGLGASYSFK